MSNYKSQINPVQQSQHPAGLKTEYIVIPSQSAPSFGAQFTIFLNQTSSSCSINSCNAICRITRMTQKVVDDTVMMLARTPTTYLFSDIKYQSFVAQSSITTFTGVLSNITGKVQALYFVVRPTTGLTGDNAFSFTEIAQFEVRNGGSQNIIGGSPIKSTFNQAIQSAAWLKTWYLNDSYTGVSNSYVYVYAFSIDPLCDINTGKFSSGSRTFLGTESLLITFSSALTSTYQIDVSSIFLLYS